jgi:hypothetical protein
MDQEQLVTFAAEKQVSFVLRPDGDTFVVKGKKPVVEEVLALINRDEVLDLLRTREGYGQQEVERVVAPKIPSLAEQKKAYVQWTLVRSEYYQPPADALERMWGALEEGDIVYFDYALTITVKRIRDGKFVAIDRHGRENPPSPYSPAMAQQGK